MKYWILILITLPFLSFSQNKEIQKVMSDQATAWNNGDLEGYMNGYWKNDSLTFIGSKGVTYGWDNTLKNYKKGYPTKEKMGHLSFSDVTIKPLGKNFALVIGKWKLTREKDEPKGIYTLIFQKIKKDWKIISDHTE